MHWVTNGNVLLLVLEKIMVSNVEGGMLVVNFEPNFLSMPYFIDLGGMTGKVDIKITN